MFFKYIYLYIFKEKEWLDKEKREKNSSEVSICDVNIIGDSYQSCNVISWLLDNRYMGLLYCLTKYLETVLSWCVTPFSTWPCISQISLNFKTKTQYLGIWCHCDFSNLFQVLPYWYLKNWVSKLHVEKQGEVIPWSILVPRRLRPRYWTPFWDSELSTKLSKQRWLSLLWPEGLCKEMWKIYQC